MNANGILRGEFTFVRGTCWQVYFFEAGFGSAPLPKVSEGPIASDAVKPGGQRPRIGKATQAAMDLEPDFLKHVFRTVVIADHLADKVTEPRAEPLHQLRKGCTVSGLAAQDQQLFVKRICLVAHAVDCLRSAVVTTKDRLRVGLEEFNVAPKNKATGCLACA